MSDDKIRINASDVRAFIDDGEALDTMDSFIDLLEKAYKSLDEEGGPTFVLGPVIIVNDLEVDDEEESEDDEDEESEESEDKSQPTKE